jgi:hypothetical protein
MREIIVFLLIFALFSKEKEVESDAFLDGAKNPGTAATHSTVGQKYRFWNDRNINVSISFFWGKFFSGAFLKICLLRMYIYKIVRHSPATYM